MDFENDYKVGDRVYWIRHTDDTGNFLKATIVAIESAGYLLRFDDTDYFDTVIDNEWIRHIEEK